MDPLREAINSVVCDAIEGFLFIAKNVMGEETASTVVGLQLIHERFL